MRIIFLNSWFGEAGKPYFDFMRIQSKTTDVFCLMEISFELFEKLKLILKNYEGFYEQVILLKSWKIADVMAIFLKKDLSAVNSGKLVTYRNNSNDTGFSQYISINTEEGTFHLMSVHGKSRPGHKLDTPARIEQSRKIIGFFKGKKGPKIIGGDFNLMPETESIRLLEADGYKNLIKEFDIKSTRNKVSWEQFKDKPGFTKQYFADYAFVSPDVKVKNFEVPYTEISDHLPLILDIEI
jgi:endonuclease/exonuclease/phosphatase (EEP) superfamily protein YafD